VGGVAGNRTRRVVFRELVHRSSHVPLIHGPEHERQAGALGSRDASHTVWVTVDGSDVERRRLRRQSCGRGAKAATAHGSFFGWRSWNGQNPSNDSVCVHQPMSTFQLFAWFLEKIIRERAAMDAFEVEDEFPRIGRRIMLLNARRRFAYVPL
jgi:hypothetical protein